MATRSIIGLKENDGTVRYIYCNWDGYLNGVGATLVDNYTNKEIINKLLDLGNLYELGKKPISVDNYKKATNGECVIIKDTKSEIASDVESYAYKGEDLGCDYIYLFDNNEWLFTQSSKGKFRRVLDFRGDNYGN